MENNEIIFTKKELKSQFFIKGYAFFCMVIIFLIFSGFFKKFNLREETIYILMFLLLSFNLWWFPYDTRASYPELTAKEAIIIELKNPAVISLILAFFMFILPAVYSLLFS